MYAAADRKQIMMSYPGRYVGLVVPDSREKFGDLRSPNWWADNAALVKFDPKPAEAAFSAIFSNLDKCQSDVAGEVISS